MMKFLALLPFLLTLGAAEDVADVAAAGDVTIFDAKDYRGRIAQFLSMVYARTCHLLSQPQAEALGPSGSTHPKAKIANSYQCRGNYAEVVFESRASTYIQAYSIRCSKN
ncbi:hypothetical protein CRV24_009123 [Beauveria bassiana]|nr:hypothetical protein CRV24_009123 [Beauveria bassiana]